MGLNVVIDTRGMEQKITKKMETSIRRAGVSAINKSTASTRQQAIDFINKDTGLKKNLIGSRMKLYKATPSFLSGLIRIAKTGIALDKFAPQVKAVNTRLGKRYGVTVKIGSKAPRALVPNAFLATTKRGRQMILSRKNVSSSKSYPTTRPLLIDNPIARSLINGDYISRLREIAYTQFSVTFENEFKRRL